MRSGSIGYSAFGNGKFTGTLTLGDQVTSIGRYAFQNCSGFVGDLSIPKSVMLVDDSAFTGCSGLTGTLRVAAQTIGTSPFSGMTPGVLLLEEGIRTIGASAFQGIAVSGDLNIPEGVTEIGSKAFYECDVSGELFLPASLQTIGESAFYSCTASGSLEFSSALRSIGYRAFEYCKKLTGISFAETTAEDCMIGGRAFYNCTGLTVSETTQMVIPSGATTIGENAFYNCSALSGDLVLPDTLTLLGTGAFSGCSSLDGSLTLSDGLTEIPDSAFSNCKFTGILSLPEQLTGIGNSAFYGCAFSGDLSIPNSVTMIGTWAFGGCYLDTENAGKLTLPTELTVLGDRAFENCAGFVGSLEIPGGVSRIGSFAFSGCTGLNGTLTLGNGVKTIGEKAFFGCKNLTGGLSFPDTVTAIGSGAFSGCWSLDGDLKLSAALETISASSFYGCGKLTGNLELPDTLKVLENSAFTSCKSLTGRVRIPDGVMAIGSSAFQDCIGLTGVVISDSVTQIGSKAFYACTGLEGDLNLPDQLTSLGDQAFYGCAGLSGILLFPEGLTTIGSGAFEGCAGMTGNLRLPDSLTSLGSRAFYGCSSLDGKLTLPNGLTQISDYTFSYCSNLRGDLILPDGVKTIGNRAFYECKSLDGTLVLPANLETIGGSAFYYCEKLQGELILPPGVTSVGSDAFYMCYRLGPTLMIPYSMTELPTRGFRYCEGLKVLYLPKGIAGAYYAPFDNYCKFEEVYYGGSADEGRDFTSIGIISSAVIYYDAYDARSLNIPGANYTFRAGQTVTLTATYLNSEIVEDLSFSWSSSKPEVLKLTDSQVEVIGKGYTARLTATFVVLAEGSSSVSVHGPDGLSDSCVVSTTDHKELVFVPQNGQSATEPMQMEPGDSMELVFAYRSYSDVSQDMDKIQWEVLLDGVDNSEIVTLDVHDAQIDGTNSATLTATVLAIDNGGPVEIVVSGPGESRASCSVVVPDETITILCDDGKKPDADQVLRFYKNVMEPFTLHVLYETALVETAVQEAIDAMTWTVSSGDFFEDGSGHNLDQTTSLTPKTTWTKVHDGVYDISVELTPALETVTSLKVETKNQASDVCLIYATFDVDTYRAKLYDRIANGERLPEAAMLDTYLEAASPSDLIVENLSKDLEYLGYTASWESLRLLLTALDNPANLADYDVKEEDFYYALLLNLLQGCMDQGAGMDAEALTAFGDSLTDFLGDAVQSAEYINLSDSAQQLQWMADNAQELNENTFGKKLGIAGTFFSVANVAAGTWKDYESAVANISILTQTTDAMERMLEAMLAECPQTEEALCNALQKCLTQVRSTASQLREDAELGILTSVGVRGRNALFDQAWDTLMDEVKMTCPQVALFTVACTVGTTAGNQGYMVDDLLEKHQMMVAYNHIREVAERARDTLGAVWQADSTSENAVNYLCAVDTLYLLQKLDLTLAMDYTQQALDKEELHPNDQKKLIEAMAHFETFGSSLYKAYENFRNCWMGYFHDDYPSSLMDLQYADQFEAATGIRPRRVVVVECPVNVYVRNTAGTLVAGVEDGTVFCSADDISVMLEKDKKVLYFYSNADYKLEYEGYDNGVMNVTERIFNADGQETRKLNYYNLPVEPGKSYLAADTDHLRNPGGSYVSPDGDSADYAAYTVQLQNGLVQLQRGYSASLQAYAGQQLTVLARIPAGESFTGWTSSVGTEIFADPTSPVTTVRMPGGNVTITASYGFSLDNPPSNRLILTDGEDQVLDAIPAAAFTARISAPAEAETCMLGCYDSNGRLVQVLVPEGSVEPACIQRFPVDNTHGEITELRFFALKADHTPVQACILFPQQGAS